ncbi:MULTISPECIES: DISARM system phospholipase D-like protein DrmC [unclassified Nocardioides]|uniref:DISARM system phospholipase D-like protein DrmC n=1 Tax=unclassified Nocardioides TaxID=2615069 RepID=UPI000056F2F8|nr:MULTISPECIES: DISARM system phospholipase D-like protein DrmC [unclassified Nocardioides]ABL80564.1 Phosphatidylserine/phosphatidylglycerophosphate/cardiolipin synthases and related enzymes-like protein [Nocardioides sp. JS614]
MPATVDKAGECDALEVGATFDAVFDDIGDAVVDSVKEKLEAGKNARFDDGVPGNGTQSRDCVLRAIAGAKSVHRDLTPVWTMPGNEAKVGHLTGEFHRLVQAARISVTCATYNFEKTSQMWTVLKDAAEQPGVVVTVYVDGDKADATRVQAQLPRATIYRSAELPSGKRVVSHAKFIVIDHEVLLLTSANFSFSAESRNVEFGLLVRDAALAESVESTMTSKHGSLYELV